MNTDDLHNKKNESMSHNLRIYRVGRKSTTNSRRYNTRQIFSQPIFTILLPSERLFGINWIKHRVCTIYEQSQKQVKNKLYTDESFPGLRMSARPRGPSQSPGRPTLVGALKMRDRRMRDQ